jgi:hypothetical protein
MSKYKRRSAHPRFALIDGLLDWIWSKIFGKRKKDDDDDYY